MAWLLWIVLQWTWGCRYLFEIVISSPLDLYPEVELLDQIIVLFLISWGAFILFPILAVPIYIPADNAQGIPFCHILVSICYLLSLRLVFKDPRSLKLPWLLCDLHTQSSLTTNGLGCGHVSVLNPYFSKLIPPAPRQPPETPEEFFFFQLYPSS